MLTHKQVGLKINGKQSLKLRNGSIKSNDCFKQLVMPFKIYADFESVLRGLQTDDKGSNASYTKKYQEHIPYSFVYKVVCIDDRFSKLVVLYRGENTVNDFVKATLKQYRYCRLVMKKHFN